MNQLHPKQCQIGVLMPLLSGTANPGRPSRWSDRTAQQF